MNKAISLIFSQKTWFQNFPASVYMSNFLMIVSSRELFGDHTIILKCSPQKNCAIHKKIEDCTEPLHFFLRQSHRAFAHV